MEDKKIAIARMSNAKENDTNFSPRSPAYRPPHSGRGVQQAPVVANANVDIKLKLLKEQLAEEFPIQVFEYLSALIAENKFIVDGGNLDTLEV